MKKLIFEANKKSSGEGLITPQSYVNMTARGLKLPSTAVVCPVTPLAKIVTSHGNWQKRFVSADVYENNKENICFVTGFGCGGPAVTLVVEQLIALGIKEILFVGMAGSLQKEVLPGDIVVCEESICSDGTSPHYTSKEIVRASKKLMGYLQRELTAQKLNFHTGRNWSTDSIFRETKAEIKHYQKQAVLTVDMEVSALLAVCSRRKIKTAVALVVSDFVGGKTWQPDFKNPLIWQNLNKLVEISLKK